MSRVHAILGATAVALVAATAASAAVNVKGVDASDYPTVRLSVISSSGLSKAPTLTENSRPVVGLKAENLGRAKSVVLAIDHSQSMKGKALDDAAAAARDFVVAKPKSDRIAIVSVGVKALQLTRFAADRIDADSVLATIEVDRTQGTALYDAVVLASTALRAEVFSGRVLILLTDGQEMTSKATLDQAIAAARKAHVVVFPVAIVSPDFRPGPLMRLARETGGTYHPAPSSSALKSIYSSIAAELSRTWRLEYLTAARPGDALQLEASVAGAGSASASVRVPGTAEAPSGGPSTLLPEHAYSSSFGTLLLALLVGLFVLVASAIAFAARQGAWLRGRLDAHVTPKQREGKAVRGERKRMAMFAGMFRTTETAFGHLRHWKSIQRLLERSAIPLRTVEFFYIVLGAAFLFGLLAAASGSPALVILAGFAVGGAIPFGFVWFKARRRLNAFENQLPDLLITMAASLKAGHSFRQGIQTVVAEGQAPASEEFKRVLTETRLGRPMDDALSEMAERVGSKNLDFVITSVTIQRQVGGSLAGLFDMVAEAVRNRQQFARKIKSLTAMGRMSAYVLIGLPFFMAGMLTLMNPEYMSPLYHTSIGHKLVILGLVMMGFGTVVLQKIVSFKG